MTRGRRATRIRLHPVKQARRPHGRAGESFSIDIQPSREQALEDVRRSGGRPYAIPADASDHPLGELGCVGFAEEVRAQERDEGVVIDYRVVCSVTGSMRAGMIVGFATDGRADRVIGIDASAKPEQARAHILRIAQRTAELVELGCPIAEADVALHTRYAYPEYGLPTQETLDAIRTCARLEGVLTDSV